MFPVCHRFIFDTVQQCDFTAQRLSSVCVCVHVSMRVCVRVFLDGCVRKSEKERER